MSGKLFKTSFKTFSSINISNWQQGVYVPWFDRTNINSKATEPLLSLLNSRVAAMHFEGISIQKQRKPFLSLSSRVAATYFEGIAIAGTEALADPQKII